MVMSVITFTPDPPLADGADAGIFVQGVHTPVQLIEDSGVWIHSAGSAMLEQPAYILEKETYWTWLIVETGRVTLEHKESKFELRKGECAVLPLRVSSCRLHHAKDARILWLTIDGPLATNFLGEMNSLTTAPAKQGFLPSQVILTQQIVQVLVRHAGTGDASFQLGQLLWGLLAAHSGQSVAMSATLSHEIARVVDALRRSEYRESFSLADMAAISRMPIETFRKRFSAELGLPPLSYLQFLKMERAKLLLRSGLNVRQTGIEIGMHDPYHFSKQFKQVVGMAPTAYLKHVGFQTNGKE